MAVSIRVNHMQKIAPIALCTKVKLNNVELMIRNNEFVILANLTGQI